MDVSSLARKVSEEGLYCLRADNRDKGGTLNDYDGGISAFSPMTAVKEDSSIYTAYGADPLMFQTKRTETEEVEREKEQGFFDSLLGREPETVLEEEETETTVMVTPREKDLFSDYRGMGEKTVSYVGIPFTVGGSDVRSRGGGAPKYETLHIVLPNHFDTSGVEQTLKAEYAEQGDLNRFAEELANQTTEMRPIHDIINSGGTFAGEGVDEIEDPRLAFEEGDQEFVTLYGGSYEDFDLDEPHIVQIN